MDAVGFVSKKLENAVFFRFFQYYPELPPKNFLRMRLYRAYNEYKKVGCSIVEGDGCFEYRFSNGVSFKSPKDMWNLDEFWSRIPHLLQGDLGRYELKPGDVVVDCGAYIGVFTMYAAKIIGEQGKVIAFEPDPVNYERLSKNLEMNNIHNVILLNKATWSSSGKMKFDSRGLGVSTLFVDKSKSPIIRNAEEAKSVIEVPIVTLDEELGSLGVKKVDFIKMDIEGAEIETVKGARKTLGKYDVRLAIASNHIVDGQFRRFALEKLFPELGYEAETGYPPHMTTYAKKRKPDAKA
jgi:FkbM family methyltransferase